MPKYNDETTEVTYDGDTFTVETWHDNNTNNWVTQLKTPGGFQIGEAKFNHLKRQAMNDHEMIVRDAHQMIEQYLADRSDPSEFKAFRLVI